MRMKDLTQQRANPLSQKFYEINPETEKLNYINLDRCVYITRY